MKNILFIILCNIFSTTKTLPPPSLDYYTVEKSEEIEHKDRNSEEKISDTNQELSDLVDMK